VVPHLPLLTLALLVGDTSAFPQFIIPIAIATNQAAFFRAGMISHYLQI
jgi:hypothetical protein